MWSVPALGSLLRRLSLSEQTTLMAHQTSDIWIGSGLLLLWTTLLYFWTSLYPGWNVCVVCIYVQLYQQMLKHFPNSFYYVVLPPGHTSFFIACELSRVWCFVGPWTIAHEASLSTEFSRKEYWSGLSFTPPGDLPDPRIEPTSLVSPALAGRFFTNCVTWEVGGFQDIHGWLLFSNLTIK